jgi:hypothetical protein
VLFFWFITLERKARPDHKDNTRRLTYVLTALFCIATLTYGVDLGEEYLLLVHNADPTLIAAWRLSIASSVLLGMVDFLSQMILVGISFIFGISASEVFGLNHHQIYRCWIVWTHNFYVVSPLAFLSFASLGEDYYSSL